MVQIENCAEEGDDREDDDHASYHLINNKDAVGIKLSPHLVDEPSETEPPEQGSEDDAEIAHTHFDRHIRHHEGKLAKVAMKRKTMSGLLSVTRKAVMALWVRVPCLLLLWCMFLVGLLLKQ